MKNPSQTAQRRSRAAGILGFASSRTHHTPRLIGSRGDAMRGACRAVARRLADLARPWLDAAASLPVFVDLQGRPALATIPIDASSAKFRRSRVVHRR